MTFLASAFQNSAFQSAASSDQYVNPNGSNFLAFGTPTIRNQYEYVYAVGSDFQAFGTPNPVWNWRSYVYANGASFIGFGTPSNVYNTRRYTYANGTDFQTFGTQWASFAQRYLLHAGISQSAFGTSWVRNFKQYAYPNGSSFMAFGIPLVRDRTSYVSTWGYDQSTFGSPAVTFTKVLPPGIFFTLFGTPWLSYAPRRLYPAIMFTQEFGTPTVMIKTRYVLASGSDFSVWGLAAITPFVQTMEHRGRDTVVFGTPAITHRDQEIHPHGFFGALDYYGNYYQLFGTPFVQNKTLRATGADLSAFGIPFVSYNPRWVYPTGINQLAIGGAYSAGYTPRFVYPSGFDELRIDAEWWEWGTDAYVKFRNQVYANGFKSQAFGTPRISNWVQIFEQWNPWPATHFGIAYVPIVHQGIEVDPVP